MTSRAFDPDMPTRLRERMTYAGYLHLDRILSAQEPLSSPQHHDEMLFIIQHQTSELWLKLMVHELRAAATAIENDQSDMAAKVLSRVKHIQTQLFNQWSVLATLTPTEYTEFRDVLGSSSGFQSVQYRTVEFLLGNKDRRMIEYHGNDPDATTELTQALEAPSVYDQFVRSLARAGLDIPAEVLERDVTVPLPFCEPLVDALVKVYRDPKRFWTVYDLAEKLVDVEESFSLWRFRHMKVVARTIGFKTGTGGSAGVPFLKKMIEHEFFPELWRVRTKL